MSPSPRTPLSSSSLRPLGVALAPVLPLIAALALIALVALLDAPPAGAQELSEPQLVQDIDTVGSPLFEPCDLSACPPLYGSLPSQLTAVGNRLFFVAHDREHGAELWTSDGTAAGTRMVADLCSGPCSSNPQLLSALGGELTFRASTGTVSRDLWRTVGSNPTAVALVAGDCQGSCPNRPDAIEDELAWRQGTPSATWGGRVWFPFDGVERPGAPLWSSDGTDLGTVEAFSPCPAGEEPCDAGVEAIEVHGDRLWASLASTPNTPARLVRGLADGTAEVVATTCGEGAGAPRELASAGLGGDLLFIAPCLDQDPGPPGGPHLYRSDGTPDGTRLVRAFDPAPFQSPDGPYGARELVVFGSVVFFAVSTPQGDEVWRTDGTEGGTLPVLEGFERDGIERLLPLFDRLLILARDASGDTVLSVLEPDGSVVVLRDAPITELTPLRGSRALLSSFEGSRGWEPWETDGTPSGTRRLGDVNPGIGSSLPIHFTAAGDFVYFSADDGVVDRELWATRTNGGSTPGPGIPEVPDGPSFTSPELPGFRTWVRITSPQGDEQAVRAEGDCIPETICVSGAVPGRSELFVRIIGPRPNGYLWPVLVRFTPSRVEVWIEQIATGQVQYYELPAIDPAGDELPGLTDRFGFLP